MSHADHIWAAKLESSNINHYLSYPVISKCICKAALTSRSILQLHVSQVCSRQHKVKKIKTMA